ncbi:MAG: hypothetical protein LC672_00005 [Acidobacteria bacterium]|nr:hypothetical protein [Acidobacteriota bacterium]
MAGNPKDKLTRLQEEARRADQALLDAILARLPELEDLVRVTGREYEDRLYRFYHQSNKVYYLQGDTRRAAALFREIGREVGRELNPWFEEIVSAGTGLEFDLSHNDDWLRHTRPIVEAFLHAKYFVEMMVQHGWEFETAPRMLPSGWAALLTLYGLR